MKIFYFKYWAVLLFFLVYSCNKEKIPVLTTSDVTEVTGTSAVCGGTIIDEGSSPVIVKGVCWSTGPSPTIDDYKTSENSGSVEFSGVLNNLTPATDYNLRAYATNSEGTGYGILKSFNTSGLAAISTSPVIDITYTTAKCSGVISDDGGSIVTARGVCWSTAPNPSIADSITSNGAGSGSFDSYLKNLAPGQSYYVRAYATNIVGTVYGNSNTFITPSTVTDIDNNVYEVVKIGTQVWMAENLNTTRYNDGTEIPYETGSFWWCYDPFGEYCSYEYKPGDPQSEKYGKLYKWYIGEWSNPKNVCPSGWHVPSLAEWTTLVTYLGGESLASGKLREAGLSHWESPNTGATNESGFTALPGGTRYGSSGSFMSLGQLGAWWTSTSYGSSMAYAVILYFNSPMWMGGNTYAMDGNSIRCINNN